MAEKVRQFAQLSDASDLVNRVVVRVHLHVSDGQSLTADQMQYFSRITRKNARSRFVIHYKSSHMLPKDIPHVVIDEINETN